MCDIHYSLTLCVCVCVSWAKAVLEWLCVYEAAAESVVEIKRFGSRFGSKRLFEQKFSDQACVGCGSSKGSN